jgi:hypothetical protein
MKLLDAIQIKGDTLWWWVVWDSIAKYHKVERKGYVTLKKRFASFWYFGGGGGYRTMSLKDTKKELTKKVSRII